MAATVSIVADVQPRELEDPSAKKGDGPTSYVPLDEPST